MPLAPQHIRLRSRPFGKCQELPVPKGQSVNSQAFQPWVDNPQGLNPERIFPFTITDHLNLFRISDFGFRISGFASLLMLLCLALPVSAAGVRVRDLAMVAGARDNQL